MTNKEAVKILISYLPKDEPYNTEDREAFFMAVRLLEQEPKIITCKDCSVKQFDKSESVETGVEKYFCSVVGNYVDETPNFYCANAEK